MASSYTTILPFAMKSASLFLWCFLFLTLHIHCIPIQQDTRHNGIDRLYGDSMAEVTELMVPSVMAAILAGVLMAIAKPFIKVAVNVFTGNRLIESWWEHKAKYDKERTEAEVRNAQLVEIMKQSAAVAKREEMEGVSMGPRETCFYLKSIQI